MINKITCGLILTYLLLSGNIVMSAELLVKPKGMDILRISPDPRGSSLGQAGVGFSGSGITGLYWNPSALAGIKNNALAVMHHEWLSDIRYEFIGYEQAVKDAYLGVAFAYLHMGSIQGRDIDRHPIDYQAYDTMTNLSYAKVYQYLGYGATIKVITSRIENNTAKGIGLDLGTVYNLDNQLGFGISINNIGIKRQRFIAESDNLPLNLRLGGYYKNKYRLLTVAELLKEPDRKTVFITGIEYELLENSRNNIYLRMGYNSDKGDNICGGIGIRCLRYKLDYSYVPNNSWLGDTHCLMLGVDM
ncbi:MAG: PorV/PorQ family protein [Candidatus Desantisbacteria bacterium]